MVIKQRDKSKKRNAILDAAVFVFEDMGYDRANMDSIAKVADVSKKTIYNHFTSKEALFNAVIERFQSIKMQQKQIIYQPNIPIKEQLYQFAELKIDFSFDAKQLKFIRMAFAVMLTHPEIAKQVIDNINKDEDGLQTWLKAAVKDKKLHIEDTAIATEVFWSMFSSAFFWMPMLQGGVDKKRANKLKIEFVNTFLSQYQPNNNNSNLIDKS